MTVQYAMFPDGTMIATEGMVILELNDADADMLLDNYSNHERYELAQQMAVGRTIPLRLPEL
jgi:hypothetical protein